MMSEDLAIKKLRGSGGYVMARVTDEEQKRGNLGGPELFLAGVGRLDQDRFEKYFCNKCEKEYEGSPLIQYEKPNEDLGEGVLLMEKGEYKCNACNSTIAQYRKFDATPQQNTPQPATPQSQSSQSVEQPDQSEQPVITTTQAQQLAEFIPLESFIGMSAYNSEAELVGKIQEIGLRKSGGRMNLAVKIGEDGADEKTEVQWSGISKIGDIVLLGAGSGGTNNTFGKCPSCGNQNEAGAMFCEECGNKLG